MSAADEVTEWVRKGEADFKGAVALSRRRNEPLPDLVCFHCQQAAEKYLKAHLIYHRLHFPKSHDLMLLLELSLGSAPGLEVHRELFELLNPYSVQFRYPGEESTLEEAKQAVKATRRIRNIFKVLLPTEAFAQDKLGGDLQSQP